MRAVDPPIPHLARKSPQHSTAPGGRIRLITDSSGRRVRDPRQKGRSTPARQRTGQPGTGSCVPPSAAHEIRVYVYPAAEELKHAWTAATMLLAEAPVKKPRARAARARPHNLFVLLLVLFVVSRSQIVHNLYFF